MTKSESRYDRKIYSEGKLVGLIYEQTPTEYRSLLTKN